MGSAILRPENSSYWVPTRSLEMAMARVSGSGASKTLVGARPVKLRQGGEVLILRRGVIHFA
jgi:hypothetical protein